jgi:hypothetical protein
LEYKFSASIRNTGSNTIVAVSWGYYFEPKDLTHEPLAYRFTTKTNIKPGKEKVLTDSVPSVGPAASTKLPHKNNQAFFNERVAILGLQYDDGTSWQSTGTAPTTPKTNQPE